MIHGRKESCLPLSCLLPRQEMRFEHQTDKALREILEKIGLAQQHFDVGAVKNTKMPLLSTDEQDEIIAHLELIDAKHDLATSKRNTLQDFFRTLLHELMTAKTRVSSVKLTGLQ